MPCSVTSQELVSDTSIAHWRAPWLSRLPSCRFEQRISGQRETNRKRELDRRENGDVLEQDFNVPDNLKRIFNASDDDLKKQWDDSWEEGWTDERETIFTELVRRGVDMRPGR